MFKIIYLAFEPADMIDAHNFDILPDKFETEQEAKDFILKTLIPEEFDDMVGDDDPSEFSYDVDQYENEVAFSIKDSYDTLQLEINYKIVEV